MTKRAFFPLGTPHGRGVPLSRFATFSNSDLGRTVALAFERSAP